MNDNMNGEQLYEQYAAAQDYLNNCGVDDWDDLIQGDRDAWERLADIVAGRI